jgi:hypothetical protein
MSDKNPILNKLLQKYQSNNDYLHQFRIEIQEEMTKIRYKIDKSQTNFIQELHKVTYPTVPKAQQANQSIFPNTLSHSITVFSKNEICDIQLYLNAKYSALYQITHHYALDEFPTKLCCQFKIRNRIIPNNTLNNDETNNKDKDEDKNNSEIRLFD